MSGPWAGGPEESTCVHIRMNTRIFVWGRDSLTVDGGSVLALPLGELGYGLLEVLQG